MRFRPATGVIALDEHDRVALVRHVKPGTYDFWVAPGGGLEPGEDLEAGARREAHEEAGIKLGELQLVAIEQLLGAVTATHQLKHWFFGRALATGPLAADAASTEREGIVEAQWISRAEFSTRIVFPPFVVDEFWQAKREGFKRVAILPCRQMQWE